MTESNQLAIRERADMLAPSTDSWVAVVRDVSTLAAQICDTDFVPVALRWREGEEDLGPAAARVTAVILHGRELGLPPMTALAQTHIIEGRPSVSAEAMRAMVLQAGHEIVIVKTTSAQCVMKGRRRTRNPFAQAVMGSGTGEWTEVEWTMADAQRAGIHNKKNWQKSPRQMLQARATTELCRLIFADVIHGMRSIEEFDELEAGVPEDTVEATQIESPTIRRASGQQGRPQVTAEASPTAQQTQQTTPRKRATVPQRGTQPPEERDTDPKGYAKGGVIGPSFPAPPAEGEQTSPGPDEGGTIPDPEAQLNEAASAAISQEINATAERIDEMVSRERHRPDNPHEGAGEELQPEPEKEPDPPPPTRGQITRLQMHSSRVGIGGDEMRDYRLTVFAALAGVDSLTTSNELRPDQAGRIIEVLERCKDKEALAQIVEALP